MSERSGTSVVLFTRDLRVRDNPALHAAASGSRLVVPLFVLDEGILTGDYNRPNRARFLAQSLQDLDGSLKKAGAGLVIRRGDVVEETAKVAAQVKADRVHVAHDVSRYATRREDRLHEALDELGIELQVHEDSLFVVPAGRLASAGRTYVAVFTPYHRKWEKERPRDPLPVPTGLELARISTGRLPEPADICGGDPAPDLAEGGETAGRQLFEDWVKAHAEDYDEGHDDLAGDRTSRISPYLHFGCVSTVELAREGVNAPGFVRQLAWRDFHHQVLGARPDTVRNDYRTQGDAWRDPGTEFEAWKAGKTGLPLVDAGMRQLVQEGWMHNRARLVVGHFLTKTLYIDWRLGAQHFVDHLVDGDTANNTMNWQWVAGTGTTSRANRVYNVTLQAQRHDPTGDYVRRYVPELRSIPGIKVHEPWALPAGERTKLGYPEPIVDVKEGNERFLTARGKR